MPPMTRRRFAALGAGVLGALALPRGGRAKSVAPTSPLPPLAGEARATLAGVPRGSSEEETRRAVRLAALAATDFSWLSRGDRVLIKPVCNSGGVYPFTTDPVALSAMIGLLKEKGAGQVIVGDMSGVQSVRFSPDKTRGSTRALMNSSGIAQAAESAGAEVQAFEEAGWDGFHEESPAENRNWGTGVMMPDVVNQVDHIVLMPRCARHVLAGSTLGMKAAVGWWRHDSRLVFHHRGTTLPQKTAEGNTVPSLLNKQRLVLTSATRVLSTFGPDNGYVNVPETGLVIASPSLLAHDMVSLAWLFDNIRMTPSPEKDGFFDDPHRSPRMLAIINAAVVAMLGGSWRKIISTDAPPSSPHEVIWDDPAMRRGFEVFGGVPQLEINAIGALPAPTLERLQRATAFPA
ncbi:MAG: DUF362 domain-containing protein [Myxococcota bacterium]